jgi:hypothetical protein
MMEITEKGAQRPAHRLPSSRAPILGVALYVADHVLLTDLAQVVTGGAHLVQEPADDREMADDGLRDQAALCPQIGIELLEDQIVRGERRQRCRRDHAFLTPFFYTIFIFRRAVLSLFIDWTRVYFWGVGFLKLCDAK